VNRKYPIVVMMLFLLLNRPLIILPIEVVVFMLQLWTCPKPLTLSITINCSAH